MSMWFLVCSLQEWTDVSLQWDPASYGGVRSIRITPDKIWIPDIDLYNKYVQWFDYIGRNVIIMFSK